MKVFVLGGTGSIGSAVVQELAKRSHRIVVLSRSKNSDDKLIALGARPHRGDLRAPADWAEVATACDAVIQVAATFDDDMAIVDATAMSAIVQAARHRSEPLRMIYTGGCWLYGQTGGQVATEERPFDPLLTFRWMVANGEMLLNAKNLNTAMVHPAMVYDASDGGVFHDYFSAAKAGEPIEIWGDATTRWPLVERADLANAYCDLVEQPDLVGHFNVVSEQGVPVGEIVSNIAQLFGSQLEPQTISTEDAVAKHGDWAKGPTLDQQMSARKLIHVSGWQPKVTDYRRSNLFCNISKGE